MCKDWKQLKKDANVISCWAPNILALFFVIAIIVNAFIKAFLIVLIKINFTLQQNIQILGIQLDECISSGCHNKIPCIGYLDHRNWFLTVLEAEVLDQAPVWSGSWRTLFLACRQPPSCCVLTWWEGESEFWSFPLHGSPTFPKTPSPNTITLGVRAST